MYVCQLFSCICFSRFSFPCDYVCSRSGVSFCASRKEGSCVNVSRRQTHIHIYTHSHFFSSIREIFALLLVVVTHRNCVSSLTGVWSWLKLLCSGVTSRRRTSCLRREKRVKRVLSRCSESNRLNDACLCLPQASRRERTNVSRYISVSCAQQTESRDRERERLTRPREKRAHFLSDVVPFLCTYGRMRIER